MMIKKHFPILLFMSAILISFIASCAPAPEKKSVNPEKINILWLYLEDLSPYFSTYGKAYNPTPHFDDLAKLGILFTNAYCTTPVCSPARSAVITGSMPTTLGIHGHTSSRTAESAIWLPDGYKTIPELFKDAGFYTFNHGKEDYNFMYNRKHLYDGDYHATFWYTIEGEGSWSGRKKGQNFFGQIQFLGDKWALEHYADSFKVDRNSFPLPSYYPEDPLVREDWGGHLDAAKITDYEVGLVLDSLKRANLLDNTIILTFSDHGDQSLRHKQFLYDGGLHIPFIISYYGNDPKIKDKIKAGTIRTDLVSGIDFGPTTLALAGLEVPKYMEGRDVLAANYKPRDFIIGTRDRMDFTIDHMRAVRTNDFKYIRNYMPWKPYMQPNFRDRWPIYIRMKELYEQGKMNDKQAWFWAPTKKVEELYDLKNDPDETVNLAYDPKYKDQVVKMRAILDNWIKETNDQGQYPERVEQLRYVLNKWGADRCTDSVFIPLKKHPMSGTPKVSIR